MKITKEKLIEIIKEEITIIEAGEGEEVMAAIADVPKAAGAIAEKVRKEIESLAEPSGLDPLVLAQAVAAILTAG
tara:strand:- start:922 stop:1146 length:225 start_codon:yes stop_codon:yes gene_type:complete